MVVDTSLTKANRSKPTDDVADSTQPADQLRNQAAHKDETIKEFLRDDGEAHVQIPNGLKASKEANPANPSMDREDSESYPLSTKKKKRKALDDILIPGRRDNDEKMYDK